ncbi:uncharacterized protein LOC132188725 [Corylus avellana]|uniref:uncharacterized protein LOC132188725 n=1 Tax=Corylus avellana TaxID=13451 RepID=UPI001E21C1E6|nr:uncharacterized protein LOC132188725 [Corylus avellana]XP_059459239.1 uncharacterized protein LOC132188725 [Corylus avellana]XP_059459240.1 uncharacterized protein LOC132188725 [Corylus avellana]
MESLARLHNCHQTLHLSLNHRRPSFPEPISSLFLTAPTPSSSSSSAPARASSSPSSSSSSPDPLHRTTQNPKHALCQTLKSLLRITLPTIASTATAALLFTRMRFDPKPLISQPSTQEHVGESNGVKISYFDLKVKMKVVDFVLEVKPDDQAWHLLKTQLRGYSQELESARFGFQEILAKDLLCHRARCGDIRECLEMADELEGLSREIEEAMDRCRDKDIKYYLKDFKGLVARVRDSKGDVFRALKYFQELEHEEDNEL